MNKTVLFHSISCLYGFTRGYRSDNNSKNHLLTSTKITNGLLNSCFYALPIFNIFCLSKLIDRIEIRIKGLDKNDYKESYKEINGFCYDDI